MDVAGAALSDSPREDNKSDSPRGALSPSGRTAPRKKPASRPGEVNQVGDYQLGERIGKGQFGAVRKALDLKTGECFACKQMKFSRRSQSSASTIKEIMQEIELLKSLDHPNIVRYVTSIQVRDTVNIIMEYVENGSLLNLLKKFGVIPEPLCINFMQQILSGLDYLHSKGVIHRDIKAANILITKSGKVCLADFGVSSHLEEGTGRMTVVGSPNWMAPEVISMAGTSAAADIWSFGATVIELLTGDPPYAGLGSMGALYRIVEDASVPLPPDISEDMKDFLRCCFQKDPSKRSTAKELLGHPLLSKQENRENRSISIQQTEEEVAKYNLKRQDRVKNIKQISSEPQETRSPGPTKLDSLLDKLAQSFERGPLRSSGSNSPHSFYEDREKRDIEHIIDEIRVQFLELLTAKQKVDAYARRWKQEAESYKSRLRASQQIANPQQDFPSVSTDTLISNIKLLEMSMENDLQLARSIYYNIAATAMGKNCQRMGLLYTEIEGKWKRRWFIVRDNFLLIYKDSKALVPLTCVNLAHCVAMNLHDTDRKFVFKITNNNDNTDILVSAGSDETRNNWVESISNCSNWFERDCFEERKKDEAEFAATPKVRKGKSLFRSRKTSDSLSRRTTASSSTRAFSKSLDKST